MYVSGTCSNGECSWLAGICEQEIFFRVCHKTKQEEIRINFNDDVTLKLDKLESRHALYVLEHQLNFPRKLVSR